MTADTLAGAPTGFLDDGETLSEPIFGPGCFDAEVLFDPAPDIPAAIAAILDRIEMIERRVGALERQTP
ncbi:MAG: hypothetical protein AB7P02_05105 [Alphaproteobacteria bacterium]